jgi:hypothetical protein
MKNRGGKTSPFHIALCLNIWALCMFSCSLLILLQAKTPSTSELHQPTDVLPFVEDALLHHNLLDVTSMWGMGVDARRQMTRRTHVPLVTWTKAASDMLERAWVKLQNPPSCRRILYMYPWNWGLTSQMRDYSDAAIVSLATGRTLMYVQDAYRTKWCAKDAWIECYFQPLSGELCRRTQSELKDAPQFDTKRSKRFMPGTTIKFLFGDAPAAHVVNNTRFDFVIDNPAFFPHAIWEKMLKNNHVRVSDTFGNMINMTELKGNRPNLYHTLSLSALRTMLAPIIFKPKPYIEVIARARAKNLTRAHHNCVAIHLRWTDKKEDGGVAAGIEYTVDHIPPALERLERRTGRSYQCLLILSDDDVAARRALVTKLGDTYDVKPVSRLQGVFASEMDYQIYRKRGHAYFEQEVAQRDPQRAYAYSREVVIDIVTASLAADYLLGVGSSGVSQVLAQFIGADRKVDANAIAIWQEDVLMV